MNYDFEILGQKFSYPKTWHGALCIVAVVAGAFGIVWLVGRASPAQIQVFSAFFYKNNGEVESKSTALKMRQIQFWTPSEDTAPYLKDENGSIREEDKWEEVSAKDVERFVAKIDGYGRTVDGYRRFRSFGRGRHRFKAGWWWVMTVYSDFKTDDFVRDYSQFWKTKKPVYIEEITSDPHYVATNEK